MSREFAVNAIKGAQTQLERATKLIAKALRRPQPESRLPPLPVTLALTGERLETPEQLDQLLRTVHESLPPTPDRKLWLPYLGCALDAGAAALVAQEAVWAVRVFAAAGEKESLLGWAGVMNAKDELEALAGAGIRGAAICIGRMQDERSTLQLLRELHRGRLLGLICSNDLLKAVNRALTTSRVTRDGETNKERGVVDSKVRRAWEMSARFIQRTTSSKPRLATSDVFSIPSEWGSRLVDCGPDCSGGALATGALLSIAARATADSAKADGAVTDADAVIAVRDRLLGDTGAFKGLLLALGPLDREQCATVAGAMNLGLPVIYNGLVPIPGGIRLGRQLRLRAGLRRALGPSAEKNQSTLSSWEWKVPPEVDHLDSDRPPR